MIGCTKWESRTAFRGTGDSRENHSYCFGYYYTRTLAEAELTALGCEHAAFISVQEFCSLLRRSALQWSSRRRRSRFLLLQFPRNKKARLRMRRNSRKLPPRRCK